MLTCLKVSKGETGEPSFVMSSVEDVVVNDVNVFICCLQVVHVLPLREVLAHSHIRQLEYYQEAALVTIHSQTADPLGVYKSCQGSSHIKVQHMRHLPKQP